MSKALYQKEVSCPVCNEKFNTSKVKTSQCRVEKRDEDFCTYYKGENPIFYDVFICPICGYSAMEGNFVEINQLRKDKVKKHISEKWSKKSYSGKRDIEDALECYKLALYCSQVIEADNSVMASICIRLGWLYRMKNKTEEEEKFLNHAINFYTKAYEKESFPIGQMNEPTLLYIIGELYRRIGEYTESVKWFDRAVKHPLKHEKPIIEKMARDQWHLASQQRKENGEYKTSAKA